MCLKTNRQAVLWRHVVRNRNRSLKSPAIVGFKYNRLYVKGIAGNTRNGNIRRIGVADVAGVDVELKHPIAVFSTQAITAQIEVELKRIFVPIAVVMLTGDDILIDDRHGEIEVFLVSSDSETE